jgi:molybdate transport system ATP-binding protein
MTSVREIRAEFRSRRGKFTLEALFTAPATGITMLFGPSGCGKTTVLRCIAGLIHVENGLCDIAGEIWQNRNGAFVPTHKRARWVMSFRKHACSRISPCERT